MRLGPLVLLGGLGFTLIAEAASYTNLKRDEQIVFYPTIGQGQPDGSWKIEICGCVYEPEKRGLSLAAFREALHLEHIKMSPEEELFFNERARLFLVDHERRKRIVVQIAGKIFDFRRTGADGNFSATLRLNPTKFDPPAKWINGQKLGFSAVLPANDPRCFSGKVVLLSDEGLSVVSDIDDTIKISEVRDRPAMLRNTFLREFQPVPGMAVFYQKLARSNHAAFHYVSASPWQLYAPLLDFARSNGFPEGSFHLKRFRWKDKSFLDLFAGPEKYKLGVIEPLLKRFPKRSFVLVGDSGERDPEIYASLARKYPRQIVGIHIRDVTGESSESERYIRAFTGVPRELWQIFREPGKINFLIR